jgi:hypothetical protein
MTRHQIVIVGQACLEVCWWVMTSTAGLVVSFIIAVNKIQTAMLGEKRRLQMSL